MEDSTWSGEGISKNHLMYVEVEGKNIISFFFCFKEMKPMVPGLSDKDRYLDIYKIFSSLLHPIISIKDEEKSHLLPLLPQKLSWWHLILKQPVPLSSLRPLLVTFDPLCNKPLQETAILVSRRTWTWLRDKNGLRERDLSKVVTPTA